jgi:cytochrome c-type biogenesis protein CcmE
MVPSNAHATEARKDRIFMNKRARNRLIGVTAIILVLAVGAWLFLSMASGGGSYAQTVKDIAAGGNAKLVGTRVQVTGTVVAGSWDKKTNPMVFSISSDGTTSGPQVQVTYDGAAPNTFGNDTVAILTGTVERLGRLKASDMLTKCPSKYQTTTQSATIAAVLAAPEGSPISVAGFLSPGTLKDASAAQRFTLSTTATGTGPVFPVSFAGAMPAGTKDGVQVVVFGQLENHVFVATQVALGK